MWISYSFYFGLFIFKEENPTSVISLIKVFIIGLYSDIYRLIYVKLGMMIETTKL